MESSKVFGGTEECQSSESGWTMYIGSPMAGGDDDDDESYSINGGTIHDANEEHNGGGHGDDSDDSMASDASSGPSYRCGNGENGYGGMAYLKHDEKKDKYKSEKKETKPAMEKQRGIRRKEEREELVFVAKRANTTPLQSGDKVRRNSWMGKRK